MNLQYQLSKSNRLTITFIPVYEWENYVIMDINHILTVAHIYHLEIPEEKVFVGRLIQITNSLRELQSLKIHSLSLRRSRDTNTEELLILCSRSSTSKITKVYLEKMIEIGDFYFLLALCPYMKYLIMDCINNMDGESFLRIILKKINHDHDDHLRSLCFYVPEADDKVINKLDKMISSEKLY